ncbi:MAG: beta-glucosidase family protein, partial [Spirochaetota bacterium]
MFGKETCRLSREQIEGRVDELLGRLRLKEKVWLLNGNWDVVRNQVKYKNSYNPVPIKTNGNERLGISPIAFVDGPRGVVAGTSTCFPVSMARGAAFDRELERRIGEVIGKEARAQGANYFGGVCINLLRHPAWGRAQETYGEDPFLVGELGAELTKGVQHHNVMACAKHYAVNNIENTRFKVNVTADERTMREVYLPHFRKCIDAGAASVMGAYNRVRGDQACESRYLLTKVLRDDWGFEGFTISDFIFGVRDTKKALEAGLDVEMPLPVHYQKRLLKAVKEGRVAESSVDEAVRRVLRTLLVFENTPDPQSYGPEDVATPEHVALAREAAEQSMVLIKNERAVLPFTKPRKVLVAGSLAVKPNTGDHGSSRVYAPYVVTPLEGIRSYLGDSVEVVHCDETDLERATQLAAEADCVIVVAGNDFNDEGEYIVMGDIVQGENPIVTGTRNQGMPLKAWLLKKMMARMFASWETAEGEAVGGDRKNLSLKDSEIRMIEELGRANSNTVVTLVGGSAIMTSGWDEKVPAILYGWYSGMEGGTALARVLFGEVSPGGKLPFTIPRSEDDLPYFSSTDLEIEYDRYHGYTLLEKNGVKPAYPFGHGLSYTSFSFDDLRLSATGSALRATVRVTNSGAAEGAEVVQLYVGMPESGVDRPSKLLKGFQKVRLKPGESREVSIAVDAAELAYFNEATDSWVFEPGTYRVSVGPSSDERQLVSGEVVVAE